MEPTANLFWASYPATQRYAPYSSCVVLLNSKRK